MAIPNGVFYDDKQAGRSQVRFAFCKRSEVLAEAAGRLRGADWTAGDAAGPTRSWPEHGP